MKITFGLALLVTFSVKLCTGASSPPQDDSDYTGGSGDHAGDPSLGGQALGPPHSYNPHEEGSVLPPASDYDDEDYADYGSGDDYVDYADRATGTRSSHSPATEAPSYSTTTTHPNTTTMSTTTTTYPPSTASTSATTTTTSPTTTTTTTTTPPPTDVLAENGIHGTTEDESESYDYYDEYYDENYDDEDYGTEGSGDFPEGSVPDTAVDGTDTDHGTTGTEDHDDGSRHHDDDARRHDDIWEDDFSDIHAGTGTDDTAHHEVEDDGQHRPDVENPFIFEGSPGAGAESSPVDHDRETQANHDQEVWVPKVGIVPDPGSKEEEDSDEHTAAGGAGSEEGVASTEDTMDGSVQIVTHKEHERQVSIFAQPGMLAAFIGGAVVGLLCAILLVMFVVYRMRKKDEGSYPLDEPKRVPLTSSYASSGKEIYA